MNLLQTTKLKVWLTATLLVLLQYETFAQSACATELFPNQTVYQNDTRAARAAIDISTLGDVIEIPLVAHILTNETLSSGISKPNLIAAINDLNDAFQNASFHFNLCQINYVTDENLGAIKYSRRGFSNEFTMAAHTAHSNALNIYFVPDARGLSNQSVCGWSSYPADKGAFNKDWIVINNECANNGSTLIHEVGHYFNLYHTHQGTSTSLQIDEPELVDQSNCGSNVGDELCDTPAEPYRKGLGITGTVNEGCTFACDYFDDAGDAYDPDNGNGFNYMSYAPASCRVYFSPDQIKRMKVSYLFDRSYLSKVCPTVQLQPSATKDSLFLLTLYEAINGTNWAPHQWDLTLPVSSWHGITLNEQGLVTKIELPDNNLTGELPIEIGNFAALETLDLSNNQIAGSLPLSLGSLKQLKTLNLRKNILNGEILAELGNLYQLDELKLSYNQLSGSIPAKLSNLINLSYFGLTHNILSGCYHDNLSGLCDVALTSVSLGNNFSNEWNHFCSFGANKCACNRKTDSLTLLNLYTATQGHSWQNKWSLRQPIDQWHGITLNDLGCINKIDLTNNQLVGELPHALQDLQYLDTLILSNNTVCGKIPAVIGNLNRLKVLDLSGNIITGSIPIEISNLQKLETLRLNDNQLCGYIPYEIEDLTKLTTIYLANNQFTKCYHPKLIHLIDEEGEAANDFYELAFNNKCTNCNLNDWTALKALYESTNAQSSFNDQGMLSGSSPPEDCNLGSVEGIWLNDYGRVKTIFWDDADLTGTIPTNINLIEDLKSLKLDNNNLEGTLPATIGDLSNLITLYLSSNPNMEVCFPSEMLCLCDQTDVFFGNDDHFLQNSTQNFELFCNNVANNCEGNEADLIYPGDFNADGIVNHYDLLNWTLAKGAEGLARNNPTNEWLPQTCEDWEGAANGINFKHQDANGDGVVNEEDLAVMSHNYNKSILPVGDVNMNQTNNETGLRLTLQPSDGIENAFDIYFDSDDPTIQSINLQGLAFQLEVGELPIEDIHFSFLSNSKQPLAESIEEVDGGYEIAFTWNDQIEAPVNQPKTDSDPFGRGMIGLEDDSPVDDTITLKINQGIFLNGSDNFLSTEVTTLDHHFDNSDAIAGIDCQDQAISAYFGDDQQLYAETYIVTPKRNNEFTTIDPCSEVEFKSGGYIELKPGFFAEYGSMFLAANRECTGDHENRNRPVNHLINPINIYPNPAIEQTTIALDLAEAGNISLNIMDVNGKLITNLLNKATQPKGIHNIPYNTQHLPTGVYYCSLKHNETVSTQKLIVMR